MQIEIHWNTLNYVMYLLATWNEQFPLDHGKAVNFCVLETWYVIKIDERLSKLILWPINCVSIFVSWSYLLFRVVSGLWRKSPILTILRRQTYSPCWCLSVLSVYSCGPCPRISYLITLSLPMRWLQPTPSQSKGGWSWRINSGWSCVCACMRACNYKSWFEMWLVKGVGVSGQCCRL